MPPTSSSFFARKKILTSIIAIVAILVVAWFVYSRYAGPDSDKTVAEQVAEEVAKAENPFKADNPLANVEVNPFEKAKKVLNPFGQ
ncbi:MAG: hypothetical protein AAB641_00880 [Patescibacteria group bacterium]